MPQGMPERRPTLAYPAQRSADNLEYKSCAPTSISFIPIFQIEISDINILKM
jgi:hypothetical protein